MKDSDGSICKYRIDTNIEQLISLSNKQNLLLQKIAYFADLVNFSPSNKVWKIAIASKHPVLSAFQLSLSCFIMLFTETFYNYFC